MMMERPPLPLYHPTKPHERVRNVQQRHLLYLSSGPRLAPSAPQAQTVQEQPGPPPVAEDVLVPMVHHHHHHNSKKISLAGTNTWYWMGGMVLVVWILFVTLLLISHLTSGAAGAATRAEPKPERVEFALIPTQGRFLNVSLPKQALDPKTWHRTCCWQRQADQQHCDGSGLFAVHVDRAAGTLVVRVIQTDIIGAQCTFHYW